MMEPSLPDDPTSSTFQPAQLRELVLGVPWLAQLEAEELEALLKDASIQSLDAHHWLFQQDERAQWLYVVINGAVRLVRTTSDTRMATIRCVEQGDTLGELSMVSQKGEYLYSAEALRHTHVLQIDAALCREIMDRQPKCRAEFMSRLALELTERLEDLALLTQGDAMIRLATYLLRRLSDEDAPERVVNLTIPKYWLAAQLSMAPETLSRLLSKLRELEIIDVDRQRLVVRDEVRLRKLTQSVS
ncbi:Crp/Fnr family transcriptional regulator [Pistricoccus aurantiacus]|uniref:Crp/Fnr family transcriptional regulator n=1 Tax=Pistricoccus aurantiacus TaxID=1883414 RepID=A0A5B8SQ79_9GAMM|nr:Crp/Fnr family transcriptional regulator [Pistricoccus aurantiacus]QEA38177.1 Crp/Fnr family transcriptional regulator [Pistricoccus aurantiacus]